MINLQSFLELSEKVAGMYRGTAKSVQPYGIPFDFTTTIAVGQSNVVSQKVPGNCDFIWCSGSFYVTGPDDFDTRVQIIETGSQERYFNDPVKTVSAFASSFGAGASLVGMPAGIATYRRIAGNSNIQIRLYNDSAGSPLTFAQIFMSGVLVFKYD